MNKRIEKLIKKATTIHYSGPGEIEEFDPEKFAELIVREAAEVVENSAWNLPRGYKAIDQANLVKEHFGVE